MANEIIKAIRDLEQAKLSRSQRLETRQLENVQALQNDTLAVRGAEQNLEQGGRDFLGKVQAEQQKAKAVSSGQPAPPPQPASDELVQTLGGASLPTMPSGGGLDIGGVTGGAGVQRAGAGAGAATATGAPTTDAPPPGEERVTTTTTTGERLRERFGFLGGVTREPTEMTVEERRKLAPSEVKLIQAQTRAANAQTKRAEIGTLNDTIETFGMKNAPRMQSITDKWSETGDISDEDAEWLSTIKSQREIERGETQAHRKVMEGLEQQKVDISARLAVAQERLGTAQAKVIEDTLGLQIEKLDALIDSIRAGTGKTESETELLERRFDEYVRQFDVSAGLEKGALDERTRHNMMQEATVFDQVTLARDQFAANEQQRFRDNNRAEGAEQRKDQMQTWQIESIKEGIAHQQLVGNDMERRTDLAYDQFDHEKAENEKQWDHANLLYDLKKSGVQLDRDQFEFVKEWRERDFTELSANEQVQMENMAQNNRMTHAQLMQTIKDSDRSYGLNISVQSSLAMSRLRGMNQEDSKIAISEYMANTRRMNTMVSFYQVMGQQGVDPNSIKFSAIMGFTPEQFKEDNIARLQSDLSKIRNADDIDELSPAEIISLGARTGQFHDGILIRKEGGWTGADAPSTMSRENWYSDMRVAMGDEPATLDDKKAAAKRLADGSIAIVKNEKDADGNIVNYYVEPLDDKNNNFTPHSRILFGAYQSSRGTPVWSVGMTPEQAATANVKPQTAILDAGLLQALKGNPELMAELQSIFGATAMDRPGEAAP